MVNVTIICGGQTDKQKGQKLYTSDHRNLTFYSENIRMVKCEKIFPSIYKETKGMQCLDYRSLGAISPFRTVFSKGLFCRHIKTRACLGNG